MTTRELEREILQSSIYVEKLNYDEHVDVATWFMYVYIILQRVFTKGYFLKASKQS